MVGMVEAIKDDPQVSVYTYMICDACIYGCICILDYAFLLYTYKIVPSYYTSYQIFIPIIVYNIS